MFLFVLNMRVDDCLSMCINTVCVCVCLRL